MKLLETKKILKRLQEKYSESLILALNDIRPNYEGYGNQGYYYAGKGIEDRDRDTIYQAIYYLKVLFNDPNDCMFFDIDYYVTERKALDALEVTISQIDETTSKLKGLAIKYENNYAIETTLQYYLPIVEILKSIYNLDEYKLFNEPDKWEKLKQENIDLKFNRYWRKLQNRMIIHLISFFVFLLIFIAFFYHREVKDISNGNITMVVIILCAFLTIIFNLAFNNHNSFKNAWKLLLKTKKSKLIATEKKIFIQQLDDIG